MLWWWYCLSGLVVQYRQDLCGGVDGYVFFLNCLLVWEYKEVVVLLEGKGVPATIWLSTWSRILSIQGWIKYLHEEMSHKRCIRVRSHIRWRLMHYHGRPRNVLEATVVGTVQLQTEGFRRSKLSSRMWFWKRLRLKSTHYTTSSDFVCVYENTSNIILTNTIDRCSMMKQHSTL
jgi:hypothetical protein